MPAPVHRREFHIAGVGHNRPNLIEPTGQRGANRTDGIGGFGQRGDRSETVADKGGFGKAGPTRPGHFQPGDHPIEHVIKEAFMERFQIAPGTGEPIGQIAAIGSG